MTSKRSANARACVEPARFSEVRRGGQPVMVTPEVVELLRVAAELLTSGEDYGPSERDRVATSLLEVAQSACDHARVFRGICRYCLLDVERVG